MLGLAKFSLEFGHCFGLCCGCCFGALLMGTACGHCLWALLSGSAWTDLPSCFLIQGYLSAIPRRKG